MAGEPKLESVPFYRVNSPARLGSMAPSITETAILDISLFSEKYRNTIKKVKAIACQQ